MNKNRSQATLLVEIMIAVLFFALCSTVILDTFVTAREFSRRSESEREALLEIQNLSERLYAADDCEALLESMGFQTADGVWMLEKDEYRLEFVLASEPAEAGTLKLFQLRALRGGQVVAELPGARYLPGGVAE